MFHGGAMAFLNAAAFCEETVVNFGSLAILVPLLEKLDLTRIIDRHLPTDPQAEFSHGAILKVLLLARLHHPTALINIADWAADHGVEYLCNIPADKLNDDRLARSLDAFFEQRHAILADVTHEVLRVTGLNLERCHFDPTHLVLYGAYKNSQPAPRGSIDRLIDDIRSAPAHITRGYLTRYKMLQLGLTSVVDELGPVPVACHLFDGNRNGHTGVKEQYQLMQHFLNLPDNLLLVSDRGTCSAEHLATLRAQGHYGLCAGQWQDYQPLYEQHAASLNWQKASYLSQEQQRRRLGDSKLPLDDYRIAVVKHQLVDPTSKTPFDCRVLFVHSSAGARESQERREKNIVKIRAGLDACTRKLEKSHTRTTPQSVTRQITRLLGKKSAAGLFRWEIVPLTEAERASLPNPANGHRRQTHRLVYSFDQAAAEEDARHDGIYALVTTAPLTWSGDALLSEYKLQTHVEREHHELKTPLAVAPIFLKTPRRVEALVHLLFLALQAYMTLERLYRQTAQPSERRMTAERILKKFRVCALIVDHEEYGEVVHVAKLTRLQRAIFTQLSLETPTEILRKNLPPAPCP
jgi:transposase